MNLAEHYESYRKSVQKDALDGFTEYARTVPTADTHSFPTVFDYLKYATSNIKGAVEKQDYQQYRKWLGFHKEALMELFIHMVEKAVIESGKERAVAVLDITQEKGWNWYKFSKVMYEYDKFASVPRHGMFSEWPALDADEMRIVLSTKSRSWAQKALQIKTSKTKITDWQPHGFIISELQNINTERTVNDWTQEIFPWEQKTVSTAS